MLFLSCSLSNVTSNNLDSLPDDLPRHVTLMYLYIKLGLEQQTNPFMILRRSFFWHTVNNHIAFPVLLIHVFINDLCGCVFATGDLTCS